MLNIVMMYGRTLIVLILAIVGAATIVSDTAMGVLLLGVGWLVVEVGGLSNHNLRKEMSDERN